MRNNLFMFYILLVLALVYGCQPMTLQRNETPPTVERGDVVLPFTVRVDDVGFWLEEWDRIRALPEDKLELALKQREEAYAKSRGARSGLRLALLLTAGPAAVRDHARALNILEQIDISDEEAAVKAFAALLEQVIAEQQWSGDKIAEVRARLKETEVRVEELERQLQEVTDIEQSIQQRN